MTGMTRTEELNALSASLSSKDPVYYHADIVHGDVVKDIERFKIVMMTAAYAFNRVFTRDQMKSALTSLHEISPIKGME